MEDPTATLPAPLLAVAAIHLASALMLAGFGAYRALLAVRAAAWRSPAVAPAAERTGLPRVIVQLPLYNERRVAGRLLDAAAALDWPRDRLELQALDDSTDETRSLVAQRVAALARAGVPIVHLTREEREGYKAGALARGLDRSRGEFVAIFDADFVPQPDFLRRTIPCFRDPEVGLVQARWGHLNRRQSLLTQVQAVMLDGHFLVEHAARAARGSFFNFNGTAGVWRRSAIAAAGGWQADTLTEDLDLSYRAQLAGQRFVYLPDLVVPAELPADLNAFRGQQARWARGGAQAARKLLGRIWKSRLAPRVRLDATCHLLGNLSWLALAALALCTGLSHELASRGFAPASGFVDLPLFVLGTLSLAAFYVRPLRAAGGFGRALWLFPALLALGAGLSLHNARAALAGLCLGPGEFQRTAKLGEGSTGASGPAYASRRGGFFLLELGLAAWFASLVVRDLAAGCSPLGLPFLLLFACGFAYTGLRSLIDGRPAASWTARPVARASPGTSS